MEDNKSDDEVRGEAAREQRLAYEAANAPCGMCTHAAREHRELEGFGAPSPCSHAACECKDLVRTGWQDGYAEPPAVEERPPLKATRKGRHVRIEVGAFVVRVDPIEVAAYTRGTARHPLSRAGDATALYMRGGLVIMVPSYDIDEVAEAIEAAR